MKIYMVIIEIDGVMKSALGYSNKIKAVNKFMDLLDGLADPDARVSLNEFSFEDQGENDPQHLDTMVNA